MFHSQDSFVGDAKRPPNNDDIEMAMRVQKSNSDMGMEAFNKQVFRTPVICCF